MKVALAAIGGAVGASACCIGPVVFSLIGAGAHAEVETPPENPRVDRRRCVGDPDCVSASRRCGFGACHSRSS
jgi:hypothetical protein